MFPVPLHAGPIESIGPVVLLNTSRTLQNLIFMTRPIQFNFVFFRDIIAREKMFFIGGRRQEELRGSYPLTLRALPRVP